MKNNNWRTVYRVSKGEFPGVGPYRYFNNKMFEEEGKNENDPIISEAKNILVSKERWTDSPLKDVKSAIERIKQHPVFVEHGCFSSFKCQRPGPWDDPLMKYNLRNRFGSRLKLNQQRVYRSYFAFDSIEQMNEWFNDPKEFEMLKQLGFKVVSRKVREKDIIFGAKQVWVIEQ